MSENREAEGVIWDWAQAAAREICDSFPPEMPRMQSEFMAEIIRKHRKQLEDGLAALAAQPTSGDTAKEPVDFSIEKYRPALEALAKEDNGAAEQEAERLRNALEEAYGCLCAWQHVKIEREKMLPLAQETIDKIKPLVKAAALSHPQEPLTPKKEQP